MTKKTGEKIISTMIDEDELYVLTRYKANETVETDHKAVILTLEMTAQKNDDDKDITKNKRWNINSEKSVKHYKEQLYRYSEKLDSTWRIEGRIQEQ